MSKTQAHTKGKINFLPPSLISHKYHTLNDTQIYHPHKIVFLTPAPTLTLLNC